MEHDLIQRWADSLQYVITTGKIQKLLKYAQLLHETNKKYNLTGHNTIEDIIRDLIIGSIEPIIGLNVPRGTIYADIGSGGGIPGIPIGIIHPDVRGILIESNNKKANFIISAIRDLDLANLEVYQGRIEEYHFSGCREQIDIVFSRALGDLYYVIELGAPLIKVNGLLYVYSHVSEDELNEHVRQHSIDLGLTIATGDVRKERGIAASGLLFLKNNKTETRYPRKISIIKREILRHSRSHAT